MHLQRFTFAIAVIVVLAIAGAGCTSAQYNPVTHQLLYRNGIFEKQAAVIDAKFPDGAALHIEGYKSNASDLIKAGADAAATGAAAFARKSVLP